MLKTPPAIPTTVRVSDHALLRYLERVKGIDVEAARAEVASICGIASTLGARSVAGEGHVFLIADYTVTTVLPKNAKFGDGYRDFTDYRNGEPRRGRRST